MGYDFLYGRHLCCIYCGKGGNWLMEILKILISFVFDLFQKEFYLFGFALSFWQIFVFVLLVEFFVMLVFGSFSK